jgi:hypothetical protein
VEAGAWAPQPARWADLLALRGDVLKPQPPAAAPLSSTPAGR